MGAVPGSHERYRSAAGAVAYRAKYRRSLARRWSDRRERALVARALRAFGRIDRLLDCPCGAGRLLPVTAASSSRVVAADASGAMLREARDAHAAAPGVVAAAQRLPFRTGAFDVVLCHRLLHHLPDRGARAAVLGEVARVARRGAVLYFADAETPKARRRLRAATMRRAAVSAAELTEEAAAHGLVPHAPVRRLAPLFSWAALATFRKAEETHA